MRKLACLTLLVALGGGLAYAQSFSDVPAEHANYSAIEYVKSAGVVQGYSDFTFRPDRTINRAEFIKILITAAGIEPSGHNCFPDVAAQWFAPYVCAAKNNRVIAGYSDGTFQPARDIAFTEAAKVISNTLSPIQGLESDPWYRPYVDHLATARAIPRSIFEFGQKITRGEMAEIIYRLRSGVTDKPSRTYIELANGISIIHPPILPMQPPPFFPDPGTFLPPDLSLFPPPKPPPPDPPLPVPPVFYGPSPAGPIPGRYPYASSPHLGFFENDIRAEAILAGNAVYDMDTYDLYCRRGADLTASPSSFHPGITDDYGEKILNGIKMLGYPRILGRPDQGCINGVNKFSTVHHFQRAHGLPETNIIDKAFLTVFDGELRAIEERDRSIAKDFPCYEFIVPEPKHGGSKDHLVFLYALAINAFPESFHFTSQKPCGNSQFFHVASSHFLSDPWTICDPSYWPRYNDDCQLRDDGSYYMEERDDMAIVATMIHEFSHSIDKGSYPIDGNIDTSEFYAISYDLGDSFRDGGGWVYYNPIPKMPEGFPDYPTVTPPPDDPLWDEIKQHFFFYSEGWSHLKAPGYYTPYEDFAVSMEKYIMHGRVFRDYMQDKPPLREKYEWIRDNVFGGKEFNTGDPDYKEYSPDLYFPSPRLDSIIKRRKDYVWDYKVL